MPDPSAATATRPPLGSDPTQLPAAPKRQRQMRYWHEAIIDDMLAYPFATLDERSARLGYAKSTLSSLMNSDMFKAIYEGRRAQYSELLSGALAMKMASVAHKSLSALESQLETKRDALPFRDVANTTLGMLGALGFGPKAAQQGQPSVLVNVNQQNNGAAAPPQTVSAEVLEGARNRLRASEQAHVVEAVRAEALHRPPSVLLEGPFTVLGDEPGDEVAELSQEPSGSKES